VSSSDPLNEGDEALNLADDQGSSSAELDKDKGTFPEDRGQLPVDTRRVLVQLLQGPSLDGRRQNKLWTVLLRDEVVLRSRLHDLFLDLVIDHDQKVAFTRQVVAESLDAPILLRSMSLTLLESALVLHLRQQLTHADAQGERAVVSRDDMREHLSVYERVENVDRAKFNRQVEGAIEKAKKLSLLHSLRSNDERFEVSPTLKLLFSAEAISALTLTYENVIAKGRGVTAGSDGALVQPNEGQPEGSMWGPL
jgi:hypothetical protein